MSNQPEFILFPLQNARTGFKPVALPVVLIVPWRRTLGDIATTDSAVSNVKFYVEGVTGRTPVAGAEHAGLFVPNQDIYRVDISDLELSALKIDVTNLQFVDALGIDKTWSDAVTGDQMRVQLRAGGVIDLITFYEHADYYDFSSISITTADLQPVGTYKFILDAQYLRRVLSPDDDFVSIDSSELLTARLAISFNHPGQIHNEMVQRTPSLYFKGNQLDQDETVDFYRPFADALQDIFDEQDLLLGVNWIDRIPAQYIPYLAYLLGWDLPHFDTSTDEMRRVVLKNARRLQDLKGTRRVVVELFEILGFTIDVVNLWYRTNGTGFIAPNERLPASLESEKITTSRVLTADLLLSQYDTDGFADFSIPLLHRPVDQIIVETWMVKVGSAADVALSAIAEGLASDVAAYDVVQSLTARVATHPNISVSLGSNDVGYAKIILDVDSNLISSTIVSSAPFNQSGIHYKLDENVLQLTLDRHMDFLNDKNVRDFRVYALAYYPFVRINIPGKLKDLRSNRFDITILQFKDGEVPSSDILDFLLGFLFKIKAFHSLLRKLAFTVTFTEVYNVTDFTLGGQVRQAEGADAGELQVPPAIEPTDAEDRGFKATDFALRKAVLAGLDEEHAAWKLLDNGYPFDPLLEAVSRLPIPSPSGTSCQYNSRGQDRVLVDTSLDLDHEDDTRVKLCSTKGNVSDYAYKGRVDAGIETILALPLNEIVTNRPCGLMMGAGSYYLAPRYGDDLPQFKILDGIHKSGHDGGFIRIMAFPPAELHYADDLGDPESFLSDSFFAVNRPSLQIEKATMFFPGHRFVGMSNLEEDTEIDGYYFRPWDDLPNACPEQRPVRDGERVTVNLNPLIVPGTGGETLSYDLVPLIYYSNGLSMDIPNMGSYSSTLGTQATHKVWTTAIASPYMEEEEFDFATDPDLCFLTNEEKIFESANLDCGCNGTGTGTNPGGVDYIDGYPSAYGAFTIDNDDYLLTSSMIATDALTVLGLAQPAGSVEIGFKLGSGIRLAATDPALFTDPAHRMDCGCARHDCFGSAVPEIDRCHIDLYVQDGQFDFEADKLSVTTRVILAEEIVACGHIMDGSIPSMLELDSPADKLKYVDEYGVVHEAAFESNSTHTDITWVVRDPMRFGQPATGKVENGRVYKDGTITTTHQILEVIPEGVAILGEGVTINHGRFQTTFTLDDGLPSDPFAYHLDCAVSDEVSALCNGGECVGYAARSGGVVTIITSTPNTFVSGDMVTLTLIPDIEGVDPNGTFGIAVEDDHVFTFSQAGPDGGPVFGGVAM